MEGTPWEMRMAAALWQFLAAWKAGYNLRSAVMPI